MDFTMIRKKMGRWGKKYSYVVVVLAVGVLLMLWPTGGKNGDTSVLPQPVLVEPRTKTDADQLEEILEQIRGVGKVKVLLTCSAGERTVFHADEKSSSSDNSQTLEQETVLITDSNRNEEALVEQILAPEYLGAVIVCQGASDPIVKLAVSEAVSKATGLGTDRISILEMK